jgi:hypothetical protein
MYVDAVRALEEACGEAAVEALRQERLEKAVRAAAERGRQAPDTSLRAYCAELERGCRGSHRWEKVEDNETRQGYLFERCLWAEVFRSLDASDIGYWICQGDGPVATAFNPQIHFQRTKTLMEGHDCCDHVYFVRESDE